MPWWSPANPASTLDGYAAFLSEVPARYILMMSYPAYCTDAMAEHRAPLRTASTQVSAHGASLDAGAPRRSAGGRCGSRRWCWPNPHRRDPVPRPAGRAIRRNPRSIPSGSGRPPRPGTRRRQAPGPAGTLFWEDVLPGKVGAGPFEDLHFHLQDPLLPPIATIVLGCHRSGPANRSAG